MSISDKDLDEFLKIANKNEIEFKDREEARKSAEDLVRFVELIYDVYKEKKRKEESED